MTSDGWQFWVGIFTVAAGVLAGVAIVLALLARADATNHLAAERRLDFEIEVLLDLMDRIGHMGSPNLELQERVRLIGVEELPRTAWAVFLGPCPWEPEPQEREGLQRQFWLVPDPANPGEMRNASLAIAEELRGAVQRRVTKRG